MRHRQPVLLLALLLLADSHILGEQSCEEVNDAALPLWTLQRLAAEGDEEAVLALAERYHRGCGVARNEGRARQLYEQLARRENPEAEFRLGLIYLNGFGVEKNALIAETLFQRAIDHGHPDARAFLEYLNEKGFDDC
jgi:TPR repeat protein